LNARGFLLAAAIAALVLLVGCGGGSSDSEVTVQTGTLSKAEFVEKADAICEAARKEFLAKYSSFVLAHKSVISSGDEEKEIALLSEAIDTLLTPNIEGQVEQIGGLGAPSAYAPRAASFLNALQERLDELQANPPELTATTTPFKKAEDAAEKAGMQGCAESFS